MFRTPGRTATRLSAMVIAGGLAAAGVIGFAGAANAEGAKGVYQGGDVGADIFLKGKDSAQRASILKLQVDGKILRTYCIDFHTLVRSEAKYDESGWKETSFGTKADKAKVKWVLLNSFPTVDLAGVRKAVGAPELTEGEAAAATQAAIWHFTDGQNLDESNKNDGDVVKLYKYLVGDANKGDVTEPPVSLSVTPGEKAGKINDKPGIGPFEVKTNAEGKSISAKLLAGESGGGKPALVDADGKPVNNVGNGDKLYVSPGGATREGGVTFEVSGESTVQAGRVFQGVNKDGSTSQLLIVADKQKVQTSDRATAKWGNPGKGPLPEINATKDCVDGGVKVTVKNNGDESYKFKLDGKETTVAAGKSVDQVVKVAEDQAYKITIVGPDGKTAKEFTGTLDCKTAGATEGVTGGTSGGSTGGTPAPVNPKGPDLAATGSDSSNTPAILGGAGALLLAGGGLVFYMRRRNNGSNGAAA
ncbi:thioester domain-containing protein [Embleya scabrispora]|uniref:thioester domain-containing protein n=1 Tax=Embleya scabrispora TaxID=159449 RepID=UPI000366D57C|nr:thioester domain-containing protein [Embleya scabrispora]MYS82453.1 Cys-Gln thioester bond-forming surface protein [Streptomyces sp. SID5474]